MTIFFYNYVSNWIRVLYRSSFFLDFGKTVEDLYFLNKTIFRMYTIIKIFGSALLIYFISEVSKRSSLWGAILASLPFISIIAFIFLYEETKDIEKVSDLSMGIFWLVIPSLALFILLSQLLKRGLNFYPSLLVAIISTILLYFGMTLILKKFGILWLPR